MGELDNEMKVQVFYQADIAIDGLAIDPAGGYLYWTGYNSLTGVIAMMALSGHQVTFTQLMTGLDMPRAITLDRANRSVAISNVKVFPKIYL